MYTLRAYINYQFKEKIYEKLKKLSQKFDRFYNFR